MDGMKKSRTRREVLLDGAVRSVLTFLLVGIGVVASHLIADTPEQVTHLLLIGVLVLLVNISLSLWDMED